MTTESDAAREDDAPPKPEPADDARDAAEPQRAAEAQQPEAPATDPAAASPPAADGPAPESAASDDAPPQETPAKTEAAPEDAAKSEEGETATEDEAKAEEGEAAGPAAASEAKKKKKKARKKKAKKRPPPRPVEKRPLSDEEKQEVRQRARASILAKAKGREESVGAALEALDRGRSIAWLARFGRAQTGALDERKLRNLRADYEDARELEETRVRIQTLLRKRGALDEEAARQLEAARHPGPMEDLAAPYLPVAASRATVARGQGLQGLADAIRGASEATALSELVAPFVPEGSEGPVIDQALGGARDILAEQVTLDRELRGKLRALYEKEGRLRVSLRSERKGDAGRHGAVVDLDQLAVKVPPLKLLAVRRAERERVVTSVIEPPEEKALSFVHEAAAPEEHPHAGFLRAAAEDGYRRLLKPLLQNEWRQRLKRKADDLAMETYERNLRNLLLGPYAGAVPTLGVRPDVQGGHHWCVVDAQGLPVGCGQLPHEPTAGREAVLEELAQILATYEIAAVAVGTSGGRADARSLLEEALAKREGDLRLVEVHDGGTRALEHAGAYEAPERPPVPGEQRGALSLARRYQDPLAELVTLDPKVLGLGPHSHEVHQGRLRRTLDEVVESCVAHVGVDPNRASAELLARVPGFDRKCAKALVERRERVGPLRAKAALAAVDGIATEKAEEAMGFLRIPDAEDPRDRTQLHPTQYGLVDRICEQVGCEPEALFAEPKLRAQARLDALVDEEADLPALKYALYQATAGDQDPRPMQAPLLPVPEGITYETLKPGQVIQGRVLRAAAFGVFVDVGMGSDALLPLPHIGDRPGVEPATVAPVGAVIFPRILEVDPKKKKITLTTRRDARPRDERGAPGRRGPRAGGRGEGRRGRAAEGRGEPVGAGAGRGGRGGGGRDTGGRGQGGRGQGGRGAGAGRGGGKRKPGRFEGGGLGLFDRSGRKGKGRGRHQDRGPRTISLGPEEPKTPDVEMTDESQLSEQELMQRKLDALKRKLEGK